MLFGRCTCDMAVTGGFHRFDEVMKALLAGASIVHLCSALLQRGPQVITEIRSSMNVWLDEKEYHSVDQLRGSLSLRHAPDPARWERANYLAILDNYSAPPGVRS